MESYVLLTVRSAEFTVLGGELTKASGMYDEILGRDATCARALCGKGALAAEAQNWTAARNYFTQALASDCENDVAYAGMGICSMAENNADKAFTFFQAATERNPGRYLDSCRLGIHLSAIQRWSAC